MAFRQPRIDYSAADALRDTADTALQLALATIGDKKSEETNRVTLAARRLASLEQRRNTYEVAFMEKQAQIAGYIGESDNLQNIYKTGGEGKLGSSIEDITFDLYDEPFKYHKQAMEVTQNQINALGPAMASSIDKLAKLSQAYDFITKGIGATFLTGETETEMGVWGAEDLGKAAFTEKFYPDLEKGKTIPKELEVFFQRHRADPTFIESMEAKRLGADWTLEQQRFARSAEKRAAARAERERVEHEIAIGKRKMPSAEEIDKSLARASRYNPQIQDSGPAMYAVATGEMIQQSGVREKNENRAKEGQDMFDAETFRLGLMFNPEAADPLGIDESKVRSGISMNDISVKYQKLLKKKPGDPQRARAVQIQQLGARIYNENRPGKASDELKIKRGMTVRPYNTRDELIAEAYTIYRYQKDIDDVTAEEYRLNIMHILGVDLRQQGQVRGMLREFFRTNFLEGVTGKKGSFDVVKFESLGPELRILGGEWMDMVKHKYLYDIYEDRWIDEIKTWTDADTGEKREEVIYEY